MAYEKTDWKDRAVEKPRTYTITNNADGSITLTPKPGIVVQEGTPINAAKLNKIEQHLWLTNNIFNTSGPANTYSISIDGVPMLELTGVPIKIKININSTGASTLNINGYGAKPLKKANGGNVTNFKVNGIYTVVYDGANFTLQGEGGEYGTATKSDVLSGKTIGTEDGLVEGTIPSKSAQTYTPGTTDQTIANGQYLSGNQIIKGDVNLVPAYILKDKKIFNVTGSLVPLTSEKKWASGTGKILADYFVVVSYSFGFVPKFVIVYLHTQPITSAKLLYFADMDNKGYIKMKTSSMQYQEFISTYGYVNATGFKMQFNDTVSQNLDFTWFVSE